MMMGNSRRSNLKVQVVQIVQMSQLSREKKISGLNLKIRLLHNKPLMKI